jgi:hypothetical protein
MKLSHQETLRRSGARVDAAIAALAVVTILAMLAGVL